MDQLGAGRAIVPREDRVRVTLAARMRSGSGWSDACILNISSRGLLIVSSGAAQPGSFVEIRRGSQLVVARVIWRKNQRIGLCSPSPVRVVDIISDQTAAAIQANPGAVQVERRRVPRTQDQSRSHARAAEFLTIVLVAAALSAWAAVAVHEAFAAPLATVRATLAPR